MFAFLKKALVSAFNYVKSLFVEPIKQPAAIELKETKKVDYKQFHDKQSRPKWVSGLFDDYIYGRIKSLHTLDLRIRERHLDERARFTR